MEITKNHICYNCAYNDNDITCLSRSRIDNKFCKNICKQCKICLRRNYNFHQR